MHTSLAGAALLALVLAIPGAVLAQEGPCREDATRLCADAKGPRARLGCLAEKRDQLSEACRARIDRAGEGAGQARPRLEACRADLERLCPGIEPGNGALRRCLAEHREALSESCQSELGSARRGAAK